MTYSYPFARAKDEEPISEMVRDQRDENRSEEVGAGKWCRETEHQ
jgi:hypothetical protein